MPTLTGVSYGQGSGGASAGKPRGGRRRGGVQAVLGQGSGSITVSPGARPGTHRGSNAGGHDNVPIQFGGPVAPGSTPPPGGTTPPPNPLAGLDPGLQAALAAAAKNPRPIDPIELASQNVANRNYAGTDANLTAEEGQVRQQYGFDDPSDPFNKSAMLKQSFERAKAQSLNSYANRGQLYSGALQSNQDDVRGNYDQNYAALRGQYSSLLADIVRRRTGASDARLNAFDTAEGNAIARAVNTPVDPDTVAVPEPKPKPPATDKPSATTSTKPFVAPKPGTHTTTRGGVTTITGSGSGQGTGSITVPARGKGSKRRGKKKRRPGVSAVTTQGGGSISVPGR